MNTRTHHRNLDFSRLSILNPLVWLAGVLLVFVLFANWPAWFAAPAQAQAHPEIGAGSAATAPAGAYVSSDPSLPSASNVFSGRSYEVSQPIDTF